jgi:SAM-dependent methyltransferase
MNATARQIFTAAAARYGRSNPLLAVERSETERLLPELAGKRVLDLGSGPGHYASLASVRGARTAVALDLTAEMAVAAPRPSLVGDAARLPFHDGCFDVVVAALLVSYVDDRRSLFREVARVLSPGGVAVLSDLHPVASALGWRRSFQGPKGEPLVVHAAPPPVSEIEEGLASAGRAVAVLREAVIDSRLEPEFLRAGRADYAFLRGTPLLLLVRAHKGGSFVG